MSGWRRGSRCGACIVVSWGQAQAFSATMRVLTPAGRSEPALPCPPGRFLVTGYSSGARPPFVNVR